MTIIEEILQAKHIKEIIDLTDFANDCKRLVKLIHPDICKDPKATAAFAKFQELKRKYEEGFKYLDDNGEVIIKELVITLNGDISRINYSNLFGNELIKFGTENFRHYLPLSFNGREVKTRSSYLTLTGITLPEEHVRWILNRLLEFCAYMEKNGLVHGGLSLESALIEPKTHGINVISFYHTTPIGAKLRTISAKYKRFYPPKTFTDKIATTSIDLAMAKGMACVLLGDPSGIGVRLKGKISKPLVNFLLTNHDNAFVAMTDYKEMLKNNYESKFHILNL